MGLYYYSFNDYLKEKFRARVRRVSVNAGFSCPNKDGTLSDRGCVFCNEDAFTNFPSADLPLKGQISRSIKSFKEKYKAERFIAYFQNSSGTHGEISALKAAYDAILDFPEIVGLSISTRPDCVDREKLDLIADYNGRYDVWVEYGLQSAHDGTLERVSRSHTFAQFRDAVSMASSRGIKAAAHVILGLPGESREDMIKTAEVLSALPVSAVKVHILHVLRGTRLHSDFEAGEVRLLGADEYVSLACDFLEHLRPDIVIMRLVSNAREDLLVAPGWINEKHRILNKIDEEFKRRGTRQGAGVL
jgi:radical SAM protein (TIGR01212 family)